MTRKASGLLGDSEVIFSECLRYRYVLRRRFCFGPSCLYVMLNPSTADEHTNDPTVERCKRRAISSGFGSLVICNLFAFRSTDPDELLRTDDPVGGPLNDFQIRSEVQTAGTVICAWGNHRSVGSRGREVLRLIAGEGKTPMALKINKDGSPAHPLYIPYSAVPVPVALASESNRATIVQF